MMLGSSQSDSFSLPTLGRKIPGKGSSHPSISHVYIPGPVIGVTSPEPMLTTVVHEWSLLPEGWGKSILAKDFHSLTEEMASVDN